MKPEARVFRCAECGGPNREGARHCEFCRVPIATLRCSHCFHLSPWESDHCSGCGEVLGLVPAELPSRLECPDCKEALVAFDGDPGHLHDCPTCGGQFVEHNLLFNLIERRRRYADPRAPQPQNPLARRVRYLACPACATLMNRKNYGGTSGIIVDYCAPHGVWFEAGALPQLLSFVARGGLADGRRIRLGLPQPSNERQARATAAQVATAMAHEPCPIAQMRDATQRDATPGNRLVSVATGVAEGTLDLLEILGNFLLDRK